MTSSNRIWIFVTVILGIGILALGWFLGVSPKLDEAAATKSNTATIDAMNQQKTIELQQLQKDSSNLPAIRAQLAALLKQLPPNSDYPAFLNELNQIASNDSVAVTNVAFQAPTVLVPTAVASSAAATPAPAATPAAPAVVSNAVPPGTVVAIPTTLTMTGSFSSLQAATGDLQTGDRLFLVSGLDFSKVPNGSGGATNAPSGGYSVDVTGIIYVLTDGSTLINSTATPTPTIAPTTAP